MQSIAWIMSELDNGRGGWALTANLDHVRRLVRLREYATLCAGATLVVADGMPVVWASRIQGTPLPARVAGSDLISSLSEAAAAGGRSIFLLGGEAGTAEQTASTLMRRFPNLRVAGHHCPTVDFESDPQASEEIEKQIETSRPDIVYVALGSPKQELLIARLRARHPGVWWLGVAANFSFLCGKVNRAPRWMQRIGFAWLHRLAQEPSRLVKCYLRDDLPFTAGLFVHAASLRLRRQGAGPIHRA